MLRNQRILSTAWISKSYLSPVGLVLSKYNSRTIEFHQIHAYSTIIHYFINDMHALTVNNKNLMDFYILHLVNSNEQWTYIKGDVLKQKNFITFQNDNFIEVNHDRSKNRNIKRWGWKRSKSQIIPKLLEA